jgi:transcriptional regulator with XRE-family HTH domain
VEHPTYSPVDGRTLAERRKAAGVTQDAVAERIPTTRQALSRWERAAALPYVKAHKYLAALSAAVEAETAA